MPASLAATTAAGVLAALAADVAEALALAAAAGPEIRYGVLAAALRETSAALRGITLTADAARAIWEEGRAAGRAEALAASPPPVPDGPFRPRVIAGGRQPDRPGTATA